MTGLFCRIVLLLPVFLGAWLPHGFGQATELYPVPVFIEDTEVLSSMQIELTTRPINQPLDTFLAEAEGASEDVLAEFMIALLSGNTDTALQLTRDLPGVEQEQTRTLLQGYAGILSAHQERITVDRETLVGRDSLMTLRIDMEQGGEVRRVMRSLRFVDTPAGFRFEGVQRDPVTILINNAYQVIENRGAMPDFVGESRDHLYTLPGTEEGSPVRLHFDGSAVSFDALNSADTPTDPILARYATAWQAVVAGDPGTFASYWTDFSGERILNWAPDSSAETWQRTKEALRDAGRRVKFLLDADPVYFVFYHPTDPLLEEFRFQYDVVYAPEGVDPVLANFFTEGYLDDILKVPELFVDPFLRPFLERIGESPGPDYERVEQLALEAEVAAVEAELAAQEEESLPVAPVADAPEPSSRERSAFWPWALAFVVLLVVFYLLLRRGGKTKNPSQEP